MSKQLEQSVGLIVGEKNYILLNRGDYLPIGERHLDMSSVGGDIEIQVTIGESDIPSEVPLLGRGILKAPKREKKTKLIVTLSADENGQIRLYMNDTASGKEKEDFFSIGERKEAKHYSEPDEAKAEDTIPDETSDADEGLEQENDAKESKPADKSKEQPLASLIEKSPDRRINNEIEERFVKKRLIGLTDVKRDLSAMYNTLLMSDDFRRNGSSYGELLIPWNFFIGGGSGSGKHTIAEIISELLYENGMTDRKEPIITNAVSIDASKSGEFFEQLGAEGRTVVIENTELLISDVEDEKDNTKLWLFISAILKAANEKQNCFYIFLGTEDAMDRQFRKMPHLEGFVTHISIPSYDVEELKTIAKRFIEGQGLKLAPDAEDTFDKVIRNESVLPGFAGADALKILIGEAVKRKSFRYVNGGIKDKFLIARDFIEDENSDGETLEDLLNELDEMVGLSRVKQEIRDLIEDVKFDKKMHGTGGENRSRTLHMMFIGNPGTGKTDTARIVARIYGKLGLLPKPDLFIQADRSSLIGAYMGHSEKATKELVESAIGGVLFIDEAHRIVSGDQDDYGKQAFGVLIKMMEDYRDRLMVIFAGYEDMEQVLSKYDQGITSRIPTRLHFDDYSQEELLAIFELKLKKNYFPLVLDEDARKEASAHIRERSTMKNFGNARGVRNIVDDVVRVVKRRLNKEDDEIIEENAEPVTVLKEDIMASGHRKTEGRTLEDYKQELDEMIGLFRIKEEVRTMEDKIFLERARIRMGEKPSENFLLHSIFYGNAGTGKTTVARLVGQIYNKMGALPAGDAFVTVTRGDLVAEYEGQTAIKTRRAVESALGGVLFIDEAYALCTGPEDLFGMEALNTLLTLALDYHDRLMIILAGYEGPINRLMSLNQGLERRFPNQFHFDDYTEEELYQIFCKKLKDNSRVLEDGASEIIKEVIKKRSRRSNFGNGGGIDNIMKDLIGAQAVRLRPYFDSEELTPELFGTITVGDAKELLTAGID